MEDQLRNEIVPYHETKGGDTRIWVPGLTFSSLTLAPAGVWANLEPAGVWTNLEPAGGLISAPLEISRNYATHREAVNGVR